MFPIRSQYIQPLALLRKLEIHSKIVPMHYKTKTQIQYYHWTKILLNNIGRSILQHSFVYCHKSVACGHSCRWCIINIIICTGSFIKSKFIRTNRVNFVRYNVYPSGQWFQRSIIGLGWHFFYFGDNIWNGVARFRTLRRNYKVLKCY